MIIKIWGGEFFICDLANYQRINHFDYVPLPGGDKVSEEPWRMAISYLVYTFGEIPWDKNIPFFSSINKDKAGILQIAIGKRINSPLSSSAGRLFDAVAALTNICPESYFHAEAPMRLESVIDSSCREEYDYIIDPVISFKKMITQIVDDIQSGINISVIFCKIFTIQLFHLFLQQLKNYQAKPE